MVRKVNKPLAVRNLMANHPLALAFVLEAITKYAVEQLDAPAWEGHTFINQDAWKAVAQEALDVVASGD
jgi:hypothetical protein